MRFLVAGLLGGLMLLVFSLVAIPPSNAAPSTPTDWPELVLRELFPDMRFRVPIYATHAGDGSQRLFVVERDGIIRIIQNDAVVPDPFLDISALIDNAHPEQGLLGLAFSPTYETNGEFYVHYTERASDGDHLIVRYRVSADDPNRADPDSAQIVLRQEQLIWENHEGGQLQFGPDGMLYIGLGDGGYKGDPYNQAQNPRLLLGKIVRINVEIGDPLTYTIPADNPFVNDSRYRPEIWSLGLRNPWQFSFDAYTDDLYIADVGQNLWEEINLQPAASPGGENWGWRCYEGTHEYDLSMCGAASLYQAPIYEYPHAEGNCSVIGGYVYRGSTFARMNGTYFFADYCSGRIWGLRQTAAGQWESHVVGQVGAAVTNFGQDEDGNLYVMRESGQIYELQDPDGPGFNYLYLPGVMVP